jgi:TPR repeat protein
MLYSARALIALRRMPEATILLRAVADLGPDDEIGDFSILIEQLDRLQSTVESDQVWRSVVLAAAAWRNLGILRPLTQEVLSEMVAADLDGSPPGAEFSAAIDDVLIWADGGYRLGIQLTEYIRGLGTISPPAVAVAIDHATDEELTNSCGPVLAELATSLESSGQTAQADHWWTLALRLDPAGTTAQYGLALLRRGQSGQAIELLTGPDITCDDPEVAMAITDELVALDHPALTDWLHRAAELGHPTALFYLAKLERQSGDSADARLLYELAAKAGHAEAMFEYARALDHAGDREQAELWMQRAARGGYTMAYYPLGYFSAERNDMPQALRWWREGTLRGEGNSRTYLAIELAEAGDPEGEILLRISAANGDARAMEALAELARRNHNRKEARSWQAQAKQAWKQMGPTLNET